MGKSLLLLCFLVAGSLLATTAQSQPCTTLSKLYKYDTLVVGVAGTGMVLSASSVTAHSFTQDMSWATILNSGNKIDIQITESNDDFTERIGHIYVEHGASCRDEIVLIQPGRTCEKGIDGTAGKRFWVSFLENINGSGSTFKLELIATSNQNATGTVTNPRTAYSSTFSVTANTIGSLPISKATLTTEAYNSVGEVANDRALYVETNANITLYALNYENLSSDAANILPVEALGDEYYSLSFNSNKGETTGNISTPEEFLIVATENNTLVTIVPTAETGGGKAADNPFTIKLQKGQSYLVKAKLGGAVENTSFYKSITGTYIKSNKLVAVFTGHKRAKVGCAGNNSRDNLYDQLRPVRLWGTRYAAISTGQPEDLYRVLAAYDNTTFTINGMTQAPLNRGQYRDFTIDRNQSAFIESSQPVSVAQFGLSQDCMGTTVGDPYIVLLNPVENQITDITFAPFPSNVITGHYITILVNKDAKSLTQLTNMQTGTPVSLSFVDISGNNYSYATASIQPNAHSIRNDKGFIAYAFGYGKAESYAYSVGARFNHLSWPDVQLDTAYCVGETPVQFPDYDGLGYVWYTSPDDLVGSDIPPDISNITSVAGEYIYYLSQRIECSESPRRKIVITVHPLPKIIFEADLSTVCNTFDAVEVATPAGGTYTGPGCTDGKFYPRQAGLGIHLLTYIYQNIHGCESSDSANVTVLPIPGDPTITAFGATTFCKGDSVVLNAIASDAFYYQWFRNGDTIVGATKTSYTATESGTYTLAIRGVNECAADSVSNAIVVVAYKLPANPVISPAGPDSLCAGESATLNVASARATAFEWYRDGVLLTGDTTAAYIATVSGSYTVTVTGDGACPSEKGSNTTVVVVNNLPSNPTLSPMSATTFCKGSSVLLETTATNALKYDWYKDGSLLPGITGNSYAVTASGSYTVTAIGTGSCYAKNTSNTVVVTVHELPDNPLVSPSGLTNLCAGESVLLTATSNGATDYQWYRNGTLMLDKTASTLTVSASGSYTMAVTGIGNCLAKEISNIAVVVVYPLPENPIVIPQSATDFCKGSSVLLVAKSEDATSYEWYRDNVLVNGITGNSYTAYEMGNYTVKALAATSCYALNISNEVRVIVRANPVMPTIISSAGPPFYLGLDYTLRLNPAEDAVLYEWYKDDVYTGIDGRSYFISILTENGAGTYFVEASNEYCRKRSPDFVLAPIEMPDLFIPNVFTPNNDGVNDNFRIVGLEAFAKNELTIVNKRGKLEYSKKNYDNSWYGEGLPDDIYYYRFMVVTPEGVTNTYKGYVYIKRK